MTLECAEDKSLHKSHPGSITELKGKPSQCKTGSVTVNSSSGQVCPSPRLGWQGQHPEQGGVKKTHSLAGILDQRSVSHEAELKEQPQGYPVTQVPWAPRPRSCTPVRRKGNFTVERLPCHKDLLPCNVTLQGAFGAKAKAL